MFPHGCDCYNCNAVTDQSYISPMPISAFVDSGSSSIR